MIKWEKINGTIWKGKLAEMEVCLYEDGFFWTADTSPLSFVPASLLREISDKLEALQFETNHSLGRVLREMDQCSPGVQGFEPDIDPELTAYPGSVQAGSLYIPD